MFYSLWKVSAILNWTFLDERGRLRSYAVPHTLTLTYVPELGFQYSFKFQSKL